MNFRKARSRCHTIRNFIFLSVVHRRFLRSSSISVIYVLQRARRRRRQQVRVRGQSFVDPSRGILFPSISESLVRVLLTTGTATGTATVTVTVTATASASASTTSDTFSTAGTR